MGLDGTNLLLDDGDGVGGGGGGGGGAEGEGKASSMVSCSICLDAVTDLGERSWAKLQCGHQFHLDCIGSAFNIKGAMQCPNCRKIEKGQWLYATGCRSVPEFYMDDWTHDEDLYDLSYSEMSFGVHWCPFSGITRLPSSFDDGEFSSTAYHELLGQHAIFAEHTAISSATHPCPYVAYFGPVHPSSSSSNGSVSEGSSFNNHWNGASLPNEIPTYAFPGMDVHYHSWDHHSSPFPAASSRIGGTEQPSVPSVTQRAARTSSDIPRSGSFLHPFLVGHSPAARAGSSVASSMIPPYSGSVARTRDRLEALQAYFHQPSNSPSIRGGPVISGSRRSSGHRSVAQVGAVASSSDQTGGGYFFFPSSSSSSSSSSGRNFQETENPLTNRYHTWDHEHLPAFGQIDRDAGGWVPFHQAGAGGVMSDAAAAMRTSSFRQRHASDRTSSQNRS